LPVVIGCPQRADPRSAVQDFGMSRAGFLIHRVSRR
jgi:hypothetical protein